MNRILVLKSKKTYLALSVLATILSLFTVSSLNASTVHAFSAGRIIDDSVFFNGNDMSAGQIQDFLNSKVPNCDTNGSREYQNTGMTRAQWTAANNKPQPPYTCLKSYTQNTVNKSSDGFCNGHSAGNKSAAQIIYEVAKSCGINPKALLVLLQKEQSLITDDWPWPTQYQKATGYGCPDTAPCDSQYYGFFNQVYNAARQFKVYKAYPTSYNHVAGAYNNVRFHPNASCGSSRVMIENQATAGLYNYTPYQPNQALLNGGSDSCTSYGNYNFWKLYNNWFGQSTFTHPLLNYAPAVVTQVNGKINIFARGQDGRLWQKWFEGGKWKGWNYIDGPSKTAGAPSAISFQNGHMDIFETNAGQVRHDWYKNDGSAWRGWSSLGRPGGSSIGGSVSAISQASGKVNVFARGYDNRLWQTWFDNGKWRGWNYIDGPRSESSDPTAVSWDNGHMDVFEIRDGTLWHSWYSNDGGWRGWQPIGKPGSTKLKGTLAVTSQSRGKINVFARGEDGRLWQAWFERGKWKGWNYIDGPTFNGSSPTAISWADGHMDLFEVKDGKIRHKWYFSNSGWSGWETLGTP